MSIVKGDVEANLRRFATNFSVPIPASSDTSEEFLLEGTLNCIALGTTGAARVATLEFVASKTSLGLPIWASTGITATTSIVANTMTLINSNTLAPIAGLCGGSTKFRIKLAAADTLTAINVWSRVG